MSEGNQIDDSKNDDVPEDESSPIQREEPEEKIRKRDHIDILSHPNVMRLLNKQGDQIVLFADKVLKFTGSGKMKYRYLMITDFAVYLIDPETDSLRRRIALAAVEKICVSELTDNFLVVIIPTEYDLLIASARKNEIITAFVEAYEPEVVSSNRFQYNAASNMVKEIEFEEIEGTWRILFSSNFFKVGRCAWKGN
ncbi:myosin heavy chain IB isoform X1 [Vigna radiata var. radiata]|uniref:Myosin heavy chain IB isoform X1 n=1 Tax=Vigna radiata var. radiata TaxID=3916 RepID=A0A1S3VVQ2_VIGRR|nr:myosin heavy chain IB isoform X1 [Vigna radiata var. radiata]